MMILPIPTFSFCSVEVGIPALCILALKLVSSAASLGLVVLFLAKPKVDRLVVERTRGLIVPFVSFRAHDLESRTFETDEGMILVVSLTGALLAEKDEAGEG
jgi:hypothetical protein